MNENSITIKQAMISKQLKQYQLAKRLNISEFTLSRWLNRGVNEEKTKMILKIIKEW